MTRGVPQGSCLGPLLFLIYVNTLSLLPIHGKLYMFADDGAIFYSRPKNDHEELKNIIEGDLRCFSDVLNDLGLHLNALKTKMMNFHFERTTISQDLYVNVDGQVVEQVSKIRYLGLLLDSNLNWGPHIDNISQRTRSIVGILYRARNILPKDMRLLIYHTMIQSQFTYMIEVWGGATMSRLQNLQKIQNSALRNIFELPYLTPRLAIYGVYARNILPIKALYERAMSTYVFRVLRGLLQSELIFNTASHSYNSRYKELLVRLKCRTESAKKRMLFAGATVFNELPVSCKISNTLFQFKRRSKEVFGNSNRLEKYLRY